MNPPMIILVSPEYRKIEIKLTPNEFALIIKKLGNDPDGYVQKIIDL